MWTFSIPLILTTFGIIFIAELPDKTALAALALATKYKARDVVIGAWLAFIIQTIVAIAAGGLLTLLPTQPVRVLAGLGFLVFSFMAFRRKEEEIEREEEEAVSQTKRIRPVWLASFLVIFAAEWGDLTQLATATLVAQNGNALSVGIGATLALWTVTILAVVSGSQLNKVLSPERLNFISGVLFAAVGLFVIATALA